MKWQNELVGLIVQRQQIVFGRYPFYIKVESSMFKWHLMVQVEISLKYICRDYFLLGTFDFYRYIYWAEQGKYPKLCRADTDMGNIRNLSTIGIRNIQGNITNILYCAT